MNRNKRGAAAKAAFVVLATATFTPAGAHAAVMISSQQTANMSCSNGVCAPTAKNAVLNVGDLETLLATGNATVTTTGAGVEASTINIEAALTWSSATMLSLLAHKSLTVSDAVSVAGMGGLTIQTGSKGTHSFGKNGNVTFASLSSSLAIDGTSYTLVGGIKTLASDVASNPAGAFALAANYDASLDGTYPSSPVYTLFAGTFEGLGNTISNLSIDGATDINGLELEGLFAEIDTKGTVKNMVLANANITVPPKYLLAGSLVGVNNGTVIAAHASGVLTSAKNTSGAGGLVGENNGTVVNSDAAVNMTGGKTSIGGLVALNDVNAVIENSFTTGDVKASDSSSGGLVSDNFGGTIENCYATGHVAVTGTFGYAGGLVGQNAIETGTPGIIQDSYSTGDVSGGDSSYVGGFAGGNFGSIIANSYAMGGVSAKSDAEVGGLVGSNGINGAAISFSYSTGAVSGETGSNVGGLIGYDGAAAGSINESYWDTDTSGITNLSQGAGNIPNDPGITGLTTVQFQSGLPTGFDPAVWAENPNIIDGFPYLLANKPAKPK